MDELTEVRVELARLEKQEQELIGQLCNVRIAVRAQKTKLDELIRRMHAPIDRLPNELLLRILELSIDPYVLAFPSCDIYRHWKRKLASVSRHWREMVLGTPRFWSTIRLHPTWSKSFVKAHVTRSCQSPLDIEICDQRITQTFRASLDILVNCAQRWRSLIVHGPVLSSLLKRMEHRVFPSLTHISVECVPSCSTGKFLRFYSERCPQLQHLDLEKGFIPSLDFLIPPSLTSFAFDLGNRDSSPILQHVSLQKLTMLSLSGSGGDLNLHPNSLHFPLLKRFILCNVSRTKMLIRAIVAPNLSHFTYHPRDLRVGDYDAEDICSSFPAVCHMDLDWDVMMSVFRPGNIPNPDYWPNLKKLTVHRPSECSMKFLRGLITWLEGRKNMQRPKLLVKFAFPDHYDLNWGLISTLYEALHKRCILEWNVPSSIVFYNTRVYDLVSLLYKP